MKEDYYPLRRLDWLTPRERVVLRHLCDGLSAGDIARVEIVSLATVRSQISSILWKLGVDSQLAAVAHVSRECWPCPLERAAAIALALQ
jgi:two-component system nitrate/nitrite response regulator NarL